MTPTNDTATPALTGTALDTFLNRLDADLEEGGSGQAIDLAGRLRAQALLPDTIEAIERLYVHWINTGDDAATHAVLDVDGARVLDAAAPAARDEIRMRLAYARLRIASFRGDEAAARRALGEMRAVVREAPALDVDRFRKQSLYDTIDATLPGAALELAELQYELASAMPVRAALRAWDASDRERARARALQRLGRADEARAAGEAAIAALATAGADQNVDEHDWLWVGASIIDIAPGTRAAIEQAVTALLADWPLSRRREVEVRLARLAARAARANGDLDGALALCEGARYALDDSGDDFIEYELPWLIEAGRGEQAGRRAFLHLYEQGTEAHAGALRIVHERLADPDDTAFWWPLCAVRACILSETLDHVIACGGTSGSDITARSPLHAEIFASVGKLEGNALREAVYDAARAVVERRAPGHPWLVRLGATLEGQFGRIDATTEAARTLAAIEAGGLDDRRSAYSLMTARLRALGVERLLALPAPKPSGGSGCYALGCMLDDEDSEFAEAIKALPTSEARRAAWARLWQVQAAVYEHGRAQMERYFETGRGQPGDAGAHLYSMMCNNLAINLCDCNGDYDAALELHRRGIDASPFAEHYSGVLRCRIGKHDDAGTVMAGEQLWHFASEYGFSRHDGNWHCRTMVQTLDRLGRHPEKLVWLQRLVEWQRAADEDEAQLSHDALHARLDCAFYLVEPYRDQATALWDALHEQAIASDIPMLLVIAADVARKLGLNARAKQLYLRMIEVNPESPRSVNYDADDIASKIAEVDAAAARAANPGAAAAGKPWWKFWQ